MIYKKEANFPYPVLTNTSISYQDNYFLLNINVEENTNNYRFTINYQIGSQFVREQIENDSAILILIIQSKDNKFFRLDKNQKSIEISKSRISLSKRTSIQLHIQSIEELSFEKNNDLSIFYQSFKDEIIIQKHSLLGFSNVVIFEGRMQNPLSLFEKKLDENLKSDIKIELGSETIVIHYGKPDFQFNGIGSSKSLNNPYVYVGLHTALQRFITKYGEHESDYVDLEQLLPPDNLLDFKLFQLMSKKMIRELSVDNIDEVIYQISDRIIEKYANAVKELVNNGD